MKSYFNVLESVDLGTNINPMVRLYHKIWDEINSNNFCFNQSAWEPKTEEERAILRGFKINYQDYEGSPFKIFFCLDLNSVEVENVYEVASDFEEFTKKQLKPYFDYAWPIYLKQNEPTKKKRKNRKTA